jgi:hypothetical protein
MVIAAAAIAPQVVWAQTPAQMEYERQQREYRQQQEQQRQDQLRSGGDERKRAPAAGGVES